MLLIQSEEPLLGGYSERASIEVDIAESCGHSYVVTPIEHAQFFKFESGYWCQMECIEEA